jgi:hypothetical protein
LNKLLDHIVGTWHFIFFLDQRKTHI